MPDVGDPCGLEEGMSSLCHEDNIHGGRTFLSSEIRMLWKGIDVGQPKSINGHFLPIILCFKIHDWSRRIEALHVWDIWENSAQFCYEPKTTKWNLLKIFSNPWLILLILKFSQPHISPQAWCSSPNRIPCGFPGLLSGSGHFWCLECLWPSPFFFCGTVTYCPRSGSNEFALC